MLCHILFVDRVELAILRILFKKQNPTRTCSLIEGFPDDSKANVLLAISTLNNLGYISLSGHYPYEYILLNKDRRKEIIRILDPSVQLPYSLHELTIQNVTLNKEMIYHAQASKSFKITTTKKEGERNTGSHFGYVLAATFIFIFGFMSIIGLALPANNFDNQNFGSPSLLYPHISQKHFFSNGDYLNSYHWHSDKMNNNGLSATHYLSSMYPSQPALLHSILYLCGNYQFNSD